MSSARVVNTAGNTVICELQPGKLCQVGAGQSIKFSVSHTDMQSFVQTDHQLVISTKEGETYYLNNFFAAQAKLIFLDKTMSQDDVKSHLTFNILANRSDDSTQQIHASPFSHIDLSEFKQFEIVGYDLSLEDLKCSGDDLIIQFSHATPVADGELVISRFFAMGTTRANTKLVMNTLKRGQSQLTTVNPNDPHFQWTGTPPNTALVNSLYGFYFALNTSDANHVNLQASFNGEKLPEWLDLQRVDDGGYLLSGMPHDSSIGEAMISLTAMDSNHDNSYLTKQSFVMGQRFS